MPGTCIQYVHAHSSRHTHRGNPRLILPSNQIEQGGISICQKVQNLMRFGLALPSFPLCWPSAQPSNSWHTPHNNLEVPQDQWTNLMFTSSAQTEAYWCWRQSSPVVPACLPRGLVFLSKKWETRAGRGWRGCLIAGDHRLCFRSLGRRPSWKTAGRSYCCGRCCAFSTTLATGQHSRPLVCWQQSTLSPPLTRSSFLLLPSLIPVSLSTHTRLLFPCLLPFDWMFNPIVERGADRMVVFVGQQSVTDTALVMGLYGLYLYRCVVCYPVYRGDRDCMWVIVLGAFCLHQESPSQVLFSSYVILLRLSGKL